MMQAHLLSLPMFTTEAKSATEWGVFMPFQNNNKSGPPPLLFLPHTCLHHQVANAACPRARGGFSRDAVERHSVRATPQWGTARGRAGRRDASWRFFCSRCDSPRPTWRAAKPPGVNICNCLFHVTAALMPRLCGGVKYTATCPQVRVGALNYHVIV